MLSRIVAVIALNTPALAAAAQAFSPSNILVTHANTLFEYTPGGQLVQSIPVPHPDTTRYDVADVVVDGLGRAHVFNYAPFSNSYFSTYDPDTGDWTHSQENDLSFGNVSDGDLGILGNTVFSKGHKFDVTSLTSTPARIDQFNGPAEQAVGLDGSLYAINSGSPRYRVIEADPNTLDPVRSEFELRDSTGSRLDARGLAITPDGTIFAADWDGMIYKFNEQGTLLDQVATGANNLLDIDLRADGTLIVGSRFGDVVITDTEFSSVTGFEVGSELAYVGFVTIPTPGPVVLAAMCLAGAASRRRRQI